ncbi:GDSL-type esterase/lipase family protein [Granulicella aggregans]|uniref:GDSL-type esterase/lipase family protein n=1 Tax=Granulicella aggregans TaxID=474949 RepID=UPI0021DFFE5B|nr:GDSL-type esterase/lipase family protein [Granulicella aggregans]
MSANLWVVAWGASPENAAATAANPGGAEQTFRSFFYPTVSGTKERIRFSNYFGTAPVTIGAARLAIATTPPAIDTANDVPLSFSGNDSVTINPGTEVASDPVSLTYQFGQKMAVTTYVKGTFAPLNQHDSQVITNYGSPVNTGNATTDGAGLSLIDANTEWFLLSGMDVYGEYQGTVAIFGSSTIDGHNSDFGDANAYPVTNVAIPGQDDDRISDFLARTLNASGFHLGVLNAGILGEVAGPTSSSASGSPGVDRIGRDVLHQPGIKTVVIDLGQVDLRLDACGEATEVEASLQNMVAQANAVGVRVILGTIAPASYCIASSSPNYGPNPVNDGGPFAGDINPGPRNPENVQRQLVNTWIKTTGLTLPGVVGIADFEAALASPDHPDFLIPNLNSGDNFHPNGVGYQVKSQAIPINSVLPN